MTASQAINDPTTACIAKRLAQLLADKRARGELVDMQTELIMLAVRAVNDEGSNDIRALLQHIIREMRARLESLPK